MSLVERAGRCCHPPPVRALRGSAMSETVAWVARSCKRCSWRGCPCRTDREFAEEPTTCPRCGAGLGLVLSRGSWRAFSVSRTEALKRRRRGELRAAVGWLL
jgi:hypothetical protein